MELILTRAGNIPLSLERQGDTLTFNGQPLDLSAIPEGATLEPGGTDCPWVNGPITRSGGQLQIPIIAPYKGGDLPVELWYPDPILDPPDGPVALPAYEVA